MPRKYQDGDVVEVAPRGVLKSYKNTDDVKWYKGVITSFDSMGQKYYVRLYNIPSRHHIILHSVPIYLIVRTDCIRASKLSLDQIIYQYKTEYKADTEHTKRVIKRLCESTKYRSQELFKQYYIYNVNQLRFDDDTAFPAHSTTSGQMYLAFLALDWDYLPERIRSSFNNYIHKELPGHTRRN